MIQTRALVSGRVQGVFFRDFTRRTALDHGVSGWVRNRPDGRVEAVLEGEATAVEAVLEQMRDGPPQARVDDLVSTAETPEGHVGFRVR
ncbi:acylphosphatase [Guyparkeria sp.]|uniref:acylphosphatase n=1 Tax=Guyparkeria sp. TaxID=2035736 RepID=UPI003567DFBE